MNLGLDLLRLPHAQEEAWNEALLQCSTDRIASPADTLTAASPETPKLEPPSYAALRSLTHRDRDKYLLPATGSHCKPLCSVANLFDPVL